MLRPQPPDNLYESFAVANEVGSWVTDTFLREGSALHNPEHEHLLDATIGFLWTDIENTRAGKMVLGQAMIPNFKGDKWSTGRQVFQLRDWFGVEPDFVITLHTSLVEFDDMAFCAVVEHELYHCAQLTDADGNLRWTKQRDPIWTIRGHDYEGFVGTVRRYGITQADQKMIDFVEAAKHAPLISSVDVRASCGTCR